MGTWCAAIGTVCILLVYELWLAIGHRGRSGKLARTAHAELREEWFAAVSAQKGTEILAVQTIRNSLMTATLTASTAVLGLMGTLSLTVSSLHSSFGEASSGWPEFTPRLAMELMLIALLFASLVSSVVAVRYFNHASYVGGIPVESEARRKWASAGTLYVRKAGEYYSWGLRQLILVVPLVAGILHPLAGVPAAVVVVVALLSIDRFQT